MHLKRSVNVKRIKVKGGKIWDPKGNLVVLSLKICYRTFIKIVKNIYLSILCNRYRNPRRLQRL